jgi:hypothetical protein
MNFINDFALLIAVATPLAVLLGMNLFLVMEGERGTLMLPSFASPEGVAAPEQRNEAPANEENYRRAA